VCVYAVIDLQGRCSVSPAGPAVGSSAVRVSANSRRRVQTGSSSGRSSRHASSAVCHCILGSAGTTSAGGTSGSSSTC